MRAGSPSNSDDVMRRARRPGIRRERAVWWRVAVVLVASMCGLLLIGWGLGELARSLTQTVDVDAVRDVAADRTGFPTAAAHVLSAVGSGYVMFPLAVVVCIALCRRGRFGPALAIGVSTAGAVLIATVDKVLVGRPRPPTHHLEHVTSASFPSGHTMQAGAVLTALLIVYLCSKPGRAGAVAATTATAGLVLGIGFSRIYLGVHYPSDVVGGLLLGVAWAAVTASLVWVGRRDHCPMQ